MAEFLLTEPPTARPVRACNARGLYSATVHLSDHDGKTLCGIRARLDDAKHERQWWRPAEPTCRKCLSAVDSKARIKREIR